MPDLTEDTLADLHTLMGRPPMLRRGNTQLIRPANPAAGQGFTYKIDQSWWERILAVSATLTCSAAAGIRGLDLVLADGDGIPFVTIPFITAAYANTSPNGRGLLIAPGAGAAAGTYWATGSVTSPGAGAFITSVAIESSGFYTVRWSVSLAGTIAAGADSNNMQLNDGIGQFYSALMPAISNAYPQQAVQMWLVAGNQVIVSAQGAGTAASVYGATISATKADGAAPHAPLPDMVLKSSWQLKLAGVNLQAADQLSAITIVTERYPSNWADGALGGDEERQIRGYLERAAAQYRRM